MVEDCAVKMKIPGNLTTADHLAPEGTNISLYVRIKGVHQIQHQADG